MGKKKAAAKDGAKKAKPKEVDPASLPQPLKEARGAFQHNDFIVDMPSDCPGGTISHARGGVSDAALGKDIFTKGRHRWRFVIDGTSNGSAYGIVVGVADASASVKLTNFYGGAAWGVHTTSARFVSTLDCYERGFLAEPLMPREPDGSLGLKGYAKGSVVWIEVDMDQRTLSIAINDGDAVRRPETTLSAASAFHH